MSAIYSNLSPLVWSILLYRARVLVSRSPFALVLFFPLGKLGLYGVFGDRLKAGKTD